MKVNPKYFLPFLKIASWTSGILISNQWTACRGPSFLEGGAQVIFFPCSDDRVIIISSHTVIANSTYSSGSYQSILSLISNKTIHGPQSNQCIVSDPISEHQVKPLLTCNCKHFFFFCAVITPLTAWWAAPTSLGKLPLQFSASQQNKCMRDGRIKFQPSSELTATAFCPQIRFIIAFAKASCSQQWVFRWHVLHVIP